jgi:hypothetical protein
LTVTKKNAARTITAWTTGMSWAVTAADVTRPTPSRENTVSVITEPASRFPATTPTSVNAGSAALRRACPKWTRLRLAPFALAISM